MELLKLVALDTDDLEVVSAHLQDAVVSVGDVRWRPAEKRLVIGLARFDWEGAQTGHRRTFSAAAPRCGSIASTPSSAATSTAATSGDAQPAGGRRSTRPMPPAASVTLTFSGGAALRLEVECLECELVDLGPIWTTTCCPAQMPSDDMARRA